MLPNPSDGLGGGWAWGSCGDPLLNKIIIIIIIKKGGGGERTKGVGFSMHICIVHKRISPSFVQSYVSYDIINYSAAPPHPLQRSAAAESHQNPINYM